MARTTSPPLVDHTHLLHEGAGEPIMVGSPAWYAWLRQASSFVFRSQFGSFTAYKERRAQAQEYWKAYRRRAGRLQRVYLGRSSELTLDCLHAAAADLANKPAAHTTAGQATARETLAAPIDAAEHSFHMPDGDAPREPAAFSEPDDPQTLHLLATKLAIPHLCAKLMPRPRLAAQIDTAIAQRQKLLLIAAPAGFGKTTLIVEWLAFRAESQAARIDSSATTPDPQPSAPSTRAAWLALEDADNHLGQFLAYLIAALETAHPNLSTNAWGLLRAHAAHPPTQAILTSLVNALADSAEPIVLVLDDYHTITLQTIHEAIAFLLEHMPPQMQIVITTRADPPLPLARLRARGQLAELRAADLRFTAEEAADLFGLVHGIALAPDTLAALEARTEGWATGLQLAALSLQQRDRADLSTFLADFTGSHTYVFDYLADEVFQRQPKHVRDFLIQTAVLDRLCGPLCAAVTGRNDAPALLEELDQANIFLIHLDSNRRWYRYHHLFRDFLRAQLERSGDMATQALLQRRASAWFEQHGLADEAISYALVAQAWAEALRCMIPLMDSRRFYEYYLDWPRWLAALPDAPLAAEPDLCRRLAWILMFTGHVEAAARPLSLAEHVWRAVGNQEKVGELLGLHAIAWGWKGDFARAIQAAQQALALLPTDAVDRQGLPAYVLGASDLHLGHVGWATDWLIAASAVTQREASGDQSPSELFLSLATAASLARAYQLQGDLQHAAVLYRDVSTRMGSAPYLQVPSVLIYFGSLCYEWNDLAEAERLLREGIAVAERIGRGRYWPGAWGMLARVLLAKGDIPQAQLMAEHSLVTARALDNALDIAEAEMLQARLWLAQGDLAAAVRWLQTRALPSDRPLLYAQQSEYLIHARICIAQAQHTPGPADLGAIVSELQQLLQHAQADQRMADRITILALLALAHAAQGNAPQALQFLAEAIGLAAPENYIRTFVDQGAPMRALLQALHRQLPALAPDAQLLAYADRLLGSFPPDGSASPSAARTPTLLSEREQAVLLLIAEGRSIAEIAAQLVISAHTARTHVKNIYHKLESHNRVQALERARALQLL